MDTFNQIIQSKEISLIISFIMIASCGYLTTLNIKKKISAYKAQKAAQSKKNGEDA